MIILHFDLQAAVQMYELFHIYFTTFMTLVHQIYLTTAEINTTAQ